jgi:hypothetical protein
VSDEKRTQGGLSVKTLLIAGVASATAAIVIPMLWRPGTVFAAAMTPIVVALVSETLRRPVETVSSVRVRRTARGTALLDPPPAEPFDPLAPPSAEELAVLPEAATAPRAEHRRPLTGRQWKVALITGLAAFAIVAVLFTGTELLAGAPVAGESGRTTFFGGSSNSDSTSKKEQKKTRNEDKGASQADKPARTATPEPEATAPPTATASPVPTATATATPTVQPGAAAPSPTPTP